MKASLSRTWLILGAVAACSSPQQLGVYENGQNGTNSTAGGRTQAGTDSESGLGGSNEDVGETASSGGTTPTASGGISTMVPLGGATSTASGGTSPGTGSRASGASAALGTAGFAGQPTSVVREPYVPVAKTKCDCSSPDGSLYIPSSVAETASLLVGRWQFCGGGMSVSGMHDGMEFTSDRQWRSLELIDGTLTPATGFDVEGAWYVAGEDAAFDPNNGMISATGMVFISLLGTVGATGYSVAFLQNPTKMRAAGTAIFAWIGP